jgi:hypothetical protein
MKMSATAAQPEAEELGEEDIDSFLEEGENWGEESDDNDDNDDAKVKEEEKKKKKKVEEKREQSADAGKASKPEETEIEEERQGEKDQSVSGSEEKEEKLSPSPQAEIEVEAETTSLPAPPPAPAPAPAPAVVPDMSKATPEKGGPGPASALPGALPSPPPASTWNEEEEEEESGGWGAQVWGAGWGASLSDAVKTMANDFTDMGKSLADTVNETLEEEDNKIGEGSGKSAKPPTAASGSGILLADGFDSRRSKFLDQVEDQTSTDVLKDVDEKIGFLATGAASFFGSVLGSVGTVVEGGVQNATMLASSAANEFQDTFKQVCIVRIVFVSSNPVSRDNKYWFSCCGSS